MFCATCSKTFIYFLQNLVFQVASVQLVGGFFFYYFAVGDTIDDLIHTIAVDIPQILDALLHSLPASV